MDNVATIIQTGIRTLTNKQEIVLWSFNRFLLKSVDNSIVSAITVTSAVGS
jgi:hypothetical protein